MPEPGGELLTNAASGIVGTHDIILQSLDAWRPYQNGDGSFDTLFYGSDVFSGTEAQWQTVPVILGKRHPSTPYSQNPAQALSESEGVVVGNVSDVHITESGSPLLKSTLHLSDEKAESLLKSRKMALSSGFISGKKDGKLTGISGKVVPDHILVFEHTRKLRPQDGAALILNGTEGEMPEEETIKSVLSEFLAELKSLIVPAKAEPVMPASPEKAAMVANMTEQKITELEKKLADSEELIKNMTAELETFKEAEKNREKSEWEKKWDLVKNSTSPGLYATPELEATNRKAWEADPTAYLIANATRAEPTPKEGPQFVTNSTNQDDSDKDYLEFLSITGGIRR